MLSRVAGFELGGQCRSHTVVRLGFKQNAVSNGTVTVGLLLREGMQS